MDGLLSISAEEVVKTTKVPKKRTKKIPNSKFYNRLLECLDREEHPHMLRYIPNTNTNKSEFEVIFTDRKNKKNWDETKISLFKDLDDHLGIKFNRKRPPGENDCKSRFRSNMIKCIRQNFLERVSDIKKKSKTIKTYRIISRPVEQQSGVDREVARKSKSKLSKRTSKKQENKNIVPGFDDRYSEKSNTIVDSQKNESGETRYNIWEYSASKIISLHSFGKMDLSRNHYSCLSSDSQIDIASNVTNDYLNRNDGIEIINMEVPVYYSGVSKDVGVTTSYGNSEEEVFSSSGEKEIMNCELPILQSENLDFESNQPNAGMIYANSNPGYYSGVRTDVGVTISYGNSEEEVFSSSWEKKIMNCELLIDQSENLDFESNQPNAGMIYANSNVDGYRYSGVQSDENQKEENGQECLEYFMTDCEILKSNPLLCSAQNDFYDSSNSIGGNDDFANRFIRLGGAGALYP